MAFAIHTQIDGLHAKGLTGKGIHLGQLDTGVDGRHAALTGRLLHFRRFDYQGEPVVEEPTDSEWHGTHTAAIACGGSFRGRMLGVAPQAKLCSAAVINGGNVVVRILAGLDWMLDLDIRVLLMPLGLLQQTTLFDAFLAEARRRGILVVAPIGNGGAGNSRSPGNRAGVLSVGAVDETGRVPAFSGSAHQRGNVLCSKPDVLGPGVNVVSALPGGKAGGASGTSTGAAFVAGLAALLFEAKPGASAEEVEAAIIGSATPVSADQSHRCAGGIVQPLTAIDALLDGGMHYVKRSIPSDGGTSGRFVDTLLERRLRHSSKDTHVEAILGSNDFPGLISAIDDVSGRLNERPRRVRHFPRGRVSVMLATRRFLEELLMHAEIRCAHAPATEEWTLSGYSEPQTLAVYEGGHL